MSYYLRQLLEILTAPLRALLSAPGRLMAGSRRFLGISLPARLAILVEIFLLICVAVVLVIFTFHTPSRTFLEAKLNWKFWLVITALVLTIPLVLYKALKLWLEGDVSPYPDIDHAFRTGLAELRRQGIDLSQSPLFLILGSADERHEKAVFDASGLNLSLRDVPRGPAALHWCANPDGVYLLCTDTSSLSRLSRLAREAADHAPPPPGPAASAAAAGSIRGTIVAGGGGPATGYGSGPGSLATSGPVPAEALMRQGASAPPRATAGHGDIRGTMVVGNQVAGDADDGGVVAQKTVVKLLPAEATDQDRRLQYVCRLIQRARQPLCPINGILTMLPFGLIQSSPPEAIEVQRALQKDLATVLDKLKVRCPATAMVVGLEEESGFRELVRRVGRARAVGQRFGKGFSIGNPPLPERLEALAAHACGSFEDWVYTLFREKDALSKPGNTKLFGLLCKIRRSVQSRLGNILVAGFAAGEAAGRPAENFLFSGCYFAATGDTEDRQAFVQGVFDKLPQQQEDLQWTDDAYREDDRHQWFAQLGFALDTAMLLGLAGLVVYKWFPFR